MRKIFRRALVSLLCVLMLAACVLPASAKTFPDVKVDDWFYPYVSYMSEKGIIDGKPNGYFYPSDNVTRAQFIKMMTMAFGLESSGSVYYSDVRSGDWFYPNYVAASNEGFLKEVFTGTTMEPNKDLTRQEAVALLMAYLDYPEDDKAEPSYFTDYYSIKAGFRDYVLQAIDAKIIDGFTIEGSNSKEFRPNGTLLRSQAAKILAVAAGTIANEDVSDNLAFPDSQNLIVTKSCTVRNLTIGGNVIISSGVNGTVTFTNCDIGGFVSNRSSANIVFSNCTVGELNLETSYAMVDLKQTNVAELNATKSGATVTFYTKSSVSDFVIGTSATTTAIKGSGSIEELTVNASGVTSTVIPLECNIMDGLSATIDGVKYSGGMKGAPSTEWTSDKEYLELETYIDGTIRYYYTKTSTVPSATSFNTNFASADVNGSFTVIADRPYSEQIDGSAIDKEPYIVVALLNGNEVVGTPVVIGRVEAKYGFATTPTITVSNNKDNITVAPKAAGTLYYYYTFETKAPTNYNSAMSAYTAADSSVKGTLSYSGAGSRTQATKSVSTVDNYTYCVVFFVGADDTRFTPVIIERPYLSSGLDTEPYVIIGEKDDDADKLVITAGTSGSVKWFYTNSTQNFNSSFDTEYRNTDTAKKLAGTSSLSAGKETLVSLAKKSDAKDYTYVIIKFGSNQPIRLQRRDSVDGFKMTPVVMKTATKEDLISFVTVGGGTVYYMYVGRNTQFTTESFMAAYNATAADYKASITVSGTDLDRDLESKLDSDDISYEYVAFMYKNTQGEHKPVTVPRKAIGNGFNETPTAIYDADTGITQLTISSTAQYQIQYFPTDSAFELSQLVSEFNWRAKDGKNIGNIGVTDPNQVSIGTKNYNLLEDYDYKITRQYKYIAVRAIYNSDVEFTPVLIPVKLIDDGLKPSASQKLGDCTADVYFEYSDVYDSVRISVTNGNYGGRFEYFYSKTEPKTQAQYDAIFGNASLPQGSIELDQQDTGSFKTYTFNTVRSSSVVDYGYLVYRIIDTSGKAKTPGFVTIPEIHRTRISKVVTTSLPTQFTVEFNPGESQIFTIKWFFSDKQLTDVSTKFDSYYSSAQRKSDHNNNNKLANNETKVQGSVTDPKSVTTGFTLPQTTSSTTIYKYLYVVLVDALNVKYIPVEVEVPVPEAILPSN